MDDTSREAMVAQYEYHAFQIANKVYYGKNLRTLTLVYHEKTGLWLNYRNIFPVTMDCITAFEASGIMCFDTDLRVGIIKTLDTLRSIL